MRASALLGSGEGLRAEEAALTGWTGTARLGGAAPALLPCRPAAAGRRPAGPRTPARRTPRPAAASCTACAPPPPAAPGCVHGRQGSGHDGARQQEPSSEGLRCTGARPAAASAHSVLASSPAAFRLLLAMRFVVPTPRKANSCRRGCRGGMFRGASHGAEGNGAPPLPAARQAWRSASAGLAWNAQLKMMVLGPRAASWTDDSRPTQAVGPGRRQGASAACKRRRRRAGRGPAALPAHAG